MRPKVSRLYINNYRCFVNFELRPDGRSLLLGYNGTGKSSLVDLFASIQDLVWLNREAADVFSEETLSRIINSTEQSFEIDVESEYGTFRYALRIVHDPKLKLASIASEDVTLDGRPLYGFRGTEVQLYRDDHTPAKETFSFSPRRSFLASLEPKSMNKRITWFKKFIEGIWVLHINPARMAATAASDEPFLDRDAGNFSAWCRNLLTEAPESVQRAKESLKEILPGFESIRAQTVGRAKVLVVKFTAPGGKSYELDFDALSDGQKVLIALYMILYGLAGQATVLCLDEPDNFVSIREIQPFLVELANLSEENGIQRFIISHTSEVIDYLGAESAILLERPDGGQVRVGTLSPDTSLPLSELLARGWHGAA